MMEMLGKGDSGRSFACYVTTRVRLAVLRLRVKTFICNADLKWILFKYGIL